MSLDEEYDDQVAVLYRRYAGRVQGFLISTGCDRGLAEGITDDAFLAARRRWAHVASFDEPEGYVFKVARNERSKRQKEHDCRAKDLHPDPYGVSAFGGELDDAELDRRAAGFRSALRRLRDAPAEATRIDALVADARDDPSVVAIVTHAVEGDPAAWNEIVERYAPLVWSICARFQLSARDREDVAQNVWLLLVGQLGQLRQPAALPGWLATTTSRECLRVVRAARKSGQLETGLGEELQFADDTGIDEEILKAERNAALGEAFARLPDRCQQLLAMLLADPPYSYAEISARLRIPVGSIGPQRARCLERLRRSHAFIAGTPEDLDQAEATRAVDLRLPRDSPW